MVGVDICGLGLKEQSISDSLLLLGTPVPFAPGWPRPCSLRWPRPKLEGSLHLTKQGRCIAHKEAPWFGPHVHPSGSGKETRRGYAGWPAAAAVGGPEPSASKIRVQTSGE